MRGLNLGLRTWVCTVCLQKVLSKNGGKKMQKMHPTSLKLGNGLVLLIGDGKSIRLRWLRLAATPNMLRSHIERHIRYLKLHVLLYLYKCLCKLSVTIAFRQKCRFLFINEYLTYSLSTMYNIHFVTDIYFVIAI